MWSLSAVLSLNNFSQNKHCRLWGKEESFKYLDKVARESLIVTLTLTNYAVTQKQWRFSFHKNVTEAGPELQKQVSELSAFVLLNYGNHSWCEDKRCTIKINPVLRKLLPRFPQPKKKTDCQN